MGKAAIVIRGEMEETEYRRRHKGAAKVLGTPQECEECGATSPQRYAWANISGEYIEDKSDWKRLCYTCHKRFDSGRNYWLDEFCRNGHRLVLTNLKLTRSKYKRDYLSCRECIRTTARNWARKNYKVKTEPRGYRILAPS